MSLIHCTPTPIWKIYRRGGAITSERHEPKKKKTGFLYTHKQQSRLFWNSSLWSFPKVPFLLLACSCKKLFARRLEAKPKRKSYVFKNSHVSMDKTSVPPVIKIRGKVFFWLCFWLCFFWISYLPGAVAQICSWMHSFHWPLRSSGGGMPFSRVQSESLSAQHPVGQVHFAQLWTEERQLKQMIQLNTKPL